MLLYSQFLFSLFPSHWSVLIFSFTHRLVLPICELIRSILCWTSLTWYHLYKIHLCFAFVLQLIYFHCCASNEYSSCFCPRETFGNIWRQVFTTRGRVWSVSGGQGQGYWSAILQRTTRNCLPQISTVPALSIPLDSQPFLCWWGHRKFYNSEN